MILEAIILLERNSSTFDQQKQKDKSTWQKQVKQLAIACQPSN
jgi:hypothetical protein